MDGPLDTVKERGIRRRTEFRLEAGKGPDLDLRIVHDPRERFLERRGILIRQQPDVQVRRCLARDDVGDLRAMQDRRRDRVAEKRVTVRVTEEPRFAPGIL